MKKILIWFIVVLFFLSFASAENLIPHSTATASSMSVLCEPWRAIDGKLPGDYDYWCSSVSWAGWGTWDDWSPWIVLTFDKVYKVNKITAVLSEHDPPMYGIYYDNDDVGTDWKLLKSWQGADSNSLKLMQTREWSGNAVDVKRIKISADSSTYLMIVREIYVEGLDAGTDFQPALNKKEFETCARKGTEVYFNASVSNNGDSKSQAFDVSWFIDGVEQTGWGATINSLDIGKKVDIISGKWTVTEGSHNVKIVVDPKNKIPEKNEENNIASFNFSGKKCCSYWFEQNNDASCAEGFIQWKATDNSKSYLTNDFESNEYKIGGEKTLQEIYSSLKGKTIVWDLSYQPKTGPFTESIRDTGSYTFPNINIPNEATTLDFSAGDKHIISLFQNKLRFRFSSNVNSIDYAPLAGTYSWDGKSLRPNYYTYQGFFSPAVSSSFYFYFSSLNSMADNFEVSIDYYNPEKGANWVNAYYYDKSNYGNLLVLGDSFIKITDPCDKYSSGSCPSNRCSVQEGKCIEGRKEGSEYWYDSSDFNKDNIAGLIEWTDSHNSESYNSNDIKQNLISNWESSQQIFEHLKGKTIKWDIVVQSDGGSLTEPINLNGKYTFPLGGANSSREKLTFKVDSKYNLEIDNDLITIAYNSRAGSKSLVDCEACSSWTGLGWADKKEWASGSGSKDSITLDFYMHPSSMQKSSNSNNWGFNYFYVSKEGNISRWYSVSDTKNSQDKGKIFDGSYFFIEEPNSPEPDFVPSIKEPEKLCFGFYAYPQIGVSNKGYLNRKDSPEYKLYYDGELTESGTISSSGKKSQNFIYLSEGTHTLKLIIDPDNKIPETDETNNEKIISFVVAGICPDEEALLSNSNLKFQMRTAPNINGTPGKWTDWLGPDCTSNSYYTESGQQICAQHNNHGFVQYKTYIPFINSAVSKSLSEVKISFSGEVNKKPTVFLTSASTEFFVGSENKSAVFTANAFDSDGKIISYKWNFGDGTEAVTDKSVTTHNYPDAPAVYTASVIAVDDTGAESNEAEINIYVKTFNCLTNSPIKKSGDPGIYSIGDLSQEEKDKLKLWILSEYAEAKGIPLSSINTPEQYFESVAIFLNQHMGYTTSNTDTSAYNIYFLSKQYCSREFCGQCYHYSEFFTALTRLMGIDEKCVYSAIGGDTDSAHSYNIINYQGKLRIYEPQLPGITLSFNSKSRDWLNRNGNIYYAPFAIFNDAYGNGWPNCNMNAAQYTNYIDQTTAKSSSNICPTGGNWIQQGSKTYFTDICP